MTISASISDEIDSSPPPTHTQTRTHTHISVNIYAVVIYNLRLFNMENKITDVETG